MVIADPHTIRNMEPWVVTEEPWVWGDVREDGKDKLIRKFENYESEME